MPSGIANGTHSYLSSDELNVSSPLHDFPMFESK